MNKIKIEAEVELIDLNEGVFKIIEHGDWKLTVDDTDSITIPKGNLQVTVKDYTAPNKTI